MIALDKHLLKLAEQLLLRGFTLRFDREEGLIFSKCYGDREVNMVAVVEKGVPHRAALAAAKMEEQLKSQAEKAPAADMKTLTIDH